MIHSPAFARALFAGLTLITLATNPAMAIENGEADRYYRNVGLLGFDIDGASQPLPPFGLCSGFVISDRAFVTAAHCIEAARQLAMDWVVTLAPGSPEAPILPPGVLDLLRFNVTDFPILGNTMAATAIQIHPEFDAATAENDIAVLEFPANTFHVRPVRLARPGTLDWLQWLRLLDRLPIGLVGYGAETDLGDFAFFVPGYRKRGFGAVADLSRTRMMLGPSTSFNAALLPGDSGSPQFIFDRVVTLGSVSDLQRLDTVSAWRFLREFRNRR